MRKFILSAVVAVPAGLTMGVGCDREVESEKSVQVKDDGTVVKKETTVSETADGGTKKEETRSVDHPDPAVTKEETTVTKNADGTVKKEETKSVDR